MRKLMEGPGPGRPGVAGKVGELVETIRGGGWCEEQGSLMRGLAFGILDPEGERYRLAMAHRRECPACRAYVLSLRGLAAVLPVPFPAGGARGGSARWVGAAPASARALGSACGCGWGRCRGGRRVLRERERAPGRRWALASAPCRPRAPPGLEPAPRAVAGCWRAAWVRSSPSAAWSRSGSGRVVSRSTSTPSTTRRAGAGSPAPFRRTPRGWHGASRDDGCADVRLSAHGRRVGGRACRWRLVGPI